LETKRLQRTLFLWSLGRSIFRHPDLIITSSAIALFKPSLRGHTIPFLALIHQTVLFTSDIYTLSQIVVFVNQNNRGG
jgi:hypothetical protein